MRKTLVKQIKNKHLVLPVRPGTVVETETNRFKISHEIKQVFHLATTEGSPGRPYKMQNEILEFCVSNVFSHFKDLAESNALETIAFPMLGAATTRLELVEVA